MQLQINKIVGIYNSKIIVIDTIFSEKHDGLFNLILSEFETISKRQIIMKSYTTIYLKKKKKN